MPDTTATAASQNTAQQPTLLTIPQELRDRIYELAWQCATIWRPGDNEHEHYRILPTNFALVCKQMRNETRRVQRGGVMDWYHRAEAKELVMKSFWKASYCRSRSLEQWNAIIETPLNALYDKAILKGLFMLGPGSYFPRCVYFTVHAVRKEGAQVPPSEMDCKAVDMRTADAPALIAQFIGAFVKGEDGPDDWIPRGIEHCVGYHLRNHDEAARLVSEVALRTEARWPELDKTIDLRKSILRQISKHLIEYPAESALYRDLRDEMADAKALADHMQRN